MLKGIAAFLVLLVALGVMAAIAAIAIPNFRQAQVVQGEPASVTQRNREGRARNQRSSRVQSPSTGDRITALTVTFVTGLVLALVVLALLMLLFKGLGRHEQKRALHGEEQEILRQMWDQGRRLEERVMNLETILMERDGAREFGKEF